MFSIGIGFNYLSGDGRRSRFILVTGANLKQIGRKGKTQVSGLLAGVIYKCLACFHTQYKIVFSRLKADSRRCFFGPRWKHYFWSWSVLPSALWSSVLQFVWSPRFLLQMDRPNPIEPGRPLWLQQAWCSNWLRKSCTCRFCSATMFQGDQHRQCWWAISWRRLTGLKGERHYSMTTSFRLGLLYFTVVRINL